MLKISQAKLKMIQSIIAFSMVLGMFAIIMFKTGIFFETNDDRIISEILSGSMTGKPEAHMNHINYILAFPFSILYRITVQVPWYGLTLIIMSFFSLYCILNHIIKLADSWIDTILFMVVGSSLLLLNVKMIGEIQFTSVAALMSIAGYVVLFLQKQEKKMWVFFFLFELMALLLRDQAMFMIQPLGAMVVVSRCFFEKFEKKKIVQFISKWIVSLFIVFFIGVIGNFIGYSSQEWKEYKQFNKAREEIFDFLGKPVYEEVKHILDKYGVSEREYIGYINYVILDNEISVECERELIEYQKSKITKDIDNILSIKKISQAYKEVRDWRMNHITYILWISIGILLILGKRWKMLIPFCGFFVLNCFIWGYMLYRGRTPERVMLPLLLFEIVFLLVFLIKIYSIQKYRITKYVYIVLIVGCIGWLSVVSGYLQYGHLVKINTGQGIYFEGLNEIKRLCENHENKKIILDASSSMYYRGSALETQIYGPVNFVHTGTWYSTSPSMNKHLKEYFSADIKEIYLILADFENTKNIQKKCPAADYLEEKTGAKPILDDIFTVSNGTIYLVYKYQLNSY